MHQGLLSEQEAICDTLSRINFADTVHYTGAPPRFPASDRQWCRRVAEEYMQPGMQPALDVELGLTLSLSVQLEVVKDFPDWSC